MSIEIEKKKLLRRMYALDSCIKSKSPMTDDAKQLFKESIESLQKENFDAQKYLDSEKGKVDYFIFCVDSDQSDRCLERCGRCHHYIMLDSSNEHKIKCELNKDGNIICNDFDDSGFDFNERLMKFSINRCWSCLHCIEKCGDNMGPDMQCQFDYNRIKIYCEHFKDKNVSKLNT